MWSDYSTASESANLDRKIERVVNIETPQTAKPSAGFFIGQKIYTILIQGPATQVNKNDPNNKIKSKSKAMVSDVTIVQRTPFITVLGINLRTTYDNSTTGIKRTTSADVVTSCSNDPRKEHIN